jgi:hypothetical protein
LEHTKDRLEIIREYSRLLKVGGILLITFDIALNRKSEKYGINKEDSLELIGELKKYFEFDYSEKEFTHDLNMSDVYSSGNIQNENILPWPKYNLLGLLKNMIFLRESYKNIDLTICCLSCKKISK